MEIFPWSTSKIKLRNLKVILPVSKRIGFDEYCDKKYKADYLGL